MTGIRLAALDIAGTTVAEGGAVYRVLDATVRAHGAAPSDADLRAWMGADKRAAVRALLGGAPADVETVHAEFVAALTEAYRAAPPRPLGGVPEALATLRAAGVAVVLTTGFDRQVAEPLLAALGWTVGPDGPLDGLVCADDVAEGRPAPDMIRLAMELTGVADPAEVVAAGDTVLDVRAGLAAGAALVVGVRSGAQTGAELAEAGATHVLGSVAELPALVEAQT
jgi:phosphoglycolate phosphatase